MLFHEDALWPVGPLSTEFRSDALRNGARAGGRGHKDCCFYCMIPISWIFYLESPRPFHYLPRISNTTTSLRLALLYRQAFGSLQICMGVGQSTIMLSQSEGKQEHCKGKGNVCKEYNKAEIFKLFQLAFLHSKSMSTLSEPINGLQTQKLGFNHIHIILGAPLVLVITFEVHLRSRLLTLSETVFQRVHLLQPSQNVVGPIWTFASKG